jgi:hypothetical protein
MELDKIKEKRKELTGKFEELQSEIGRAHV